MTVRELIYSALVTSMIQDPRQQADAGESADALRTFKGLIEQWDLDGLFPHTQVVIPFNMEANKYEYSFATTGADIASPRPNDIIFLQVKVEGMWYALDSVSAESFFSSDLDLKVSDRPRLFFYAKDFPIGNLFVWPKPNLAYEARFCKLYQVSDLNELDDVSLMSTELSLPIGYAGAYEYALAVLLADKYGKDISPAIRQEALDRKNRILIFNAKTPIISASYLGHARQARDILKGSR